MTFPFCVPPGILSIEIAIDETIYPTGDDVVAVWEDEGGATTNLYQSVDSESDADWIELRSVNHIVVSGTRSLRLLMDTPSADPSSKQTVELKCRAEWIDVFGSANPDSGDPNIVVSLYEGTTLRASSSAGAITETPTDYSLFLTEAQINSVTDWSNIRFQAVFEASGIDIDEEVDIRVYRERIIFAP